MGMLLLTPTEAQRRTRNDDALKAVRSRELADEVNKRRSELNQTESDFQKLLASQRARWALEEQDHMRHVMQNDADAKAIEKWKQETLVHIESLRKEAENELEDVRLREKKADEKEKYSDSLALTLETRLDEVSEMQHQSSELKKSLERREKGVKMQEKLTSQRASEQAVAARIFLEKSAEREQNALIKAQDLDIREINIDSRAKTLDERAGALEEREYQVAIAELKFNSPVKKL